MPEDTPVEPPSPRASAISVGYAFQSIGLVLMMGACCFGALSGSILPTNDQPMDPWAEFFSPEVVIGAALTIGTLTSGIGGVALFAVGIGLQGEHPQSGRVGVAVTVTMTLIYAAVAATLLWRTQLSVASIAAVVFVVGSLILLSLAAHSARVLKLHPPPEDRSTVTEEQLEEMRDRRRRHE